MMALSFVTEQDFRDRIEENPLDATARLVFADWLNDHGREIEAMGQRWQAREEKRPNCKRLFRDGSAYYSQEADPASDIPSLVFEALSSHRDVKHPDERIFASNHAAETALAHALHALGIEA